MIEISDIFGLSQPLTKLVEVCSAGMGIAFKPIQIKRLAKSKHFEINEISAAIRENGDLPIAYSHGNIEIDEYGTSSLITRTQNRALYQEVKSQKNMESVIANASDELESEQCVPDNPVDEDWVTRFFSIVKDISSDEMQKLWGKILAGEIKKPGAFSLRTLETIRNITRREAEAFQRIIPYILRSCGRVFLTPNRDLDDKYHLKLDDILLLDQCGLVQYKSGLSITVCNFDLPDVVFSNDHRFLMVDEIKNPDSQITLEIYPLTNSGIELYNILAHYSCDSYFEDVAEYTFENCRGLGMYICRSNANGTPDLNGVVKKFTTKC